MKKTITYILLLAIGVAIGLGVSSTHLGQRAASVVKDNVKNTSSAMLETIVENVDSLGTRELVLMEKPALLKAIMKGGAFGGAFSRAAAEDMFGRFNQKAIDEVIELSRIELIAPRTWMLYLPIVNAVLFETDDGLVLVDTGMAPAGPAVAKLIKSVSDKAIHTIIYTHGHVDHAYGTWALIDQASSNIPNIISHKDLPARFDRYLRLRGSLAKFMSQPTASLPKQQSDLIYPNQTFEDRLELNIGGEKFVLQHHRGETNDQLYVWVPGRNALASADYYQGFLPNAGNGKRQQRHIEEWANAVAEMAALDAQILLPAHGEAITDPLVIKENLTTLSQTLQFIVDHVIEELNKGTRKGLIPAMLKLPDHLAQHPSMNEQYVSPADIAKMVMRQYTGWWDEIPSHWSPASFEAQSSAIVELSGGTANLVANAQTMIHEDIVLASHMADWAWFANPDDPIVQQLVVDVYQQRILDDRSNTMEILAYLDQLVAARKAQLNSK